MSVGLGNIGRRVRSWREEFEIAESMVAAAWGIHGDELRRVEEGEQRPPHSVLGDYTGLVRLMLAVERAQRVGAAVEAGEEIPGPTKEQEVIDRRAELYLLLDAEREEWDEASRAKKPEPATAPADIVTW